MWQTTVIMVKAVHSWCWWQKIEFIRNSCRTNSSRTGPDAVCVPYCLDDIKVLLDDVHETKPENRDALEQMFLNVFVLKQSTKPRLTTLLTMKSQTKKDYDRITVQCSNTAIIIFTFQCITKFILCMDKFYCIT